MRLKFESRQKCRNALRNSLCLMNARAKQFYPYNISTFPALLIVKCFNITVKQVKREAQFPSVL